MSISIPFRRKPAAATVYRSRARRPKDNRLALTAELEAYGWTPATLAFAGPRVAQQALTAAATRVENDTAQDLRRLIQPWQARALNYYDMVGEVNFSSQFYSRTLAKVRTFAAVLDENGDPQESDDPKLTALWDRVQDPSGGRAELQAQYGRLMFIIGEGYLTCTPDTDWGEVWEFLSPNELRVQPGGYFVRYRAPQIGIQNYVNAPPDAETVEPGVDGGPDQVIAYRLWKKHPSYSWWPDSSMHAVLDILEELLLLTLAVRAQAKSRAANNGILLWPDEMALPSLDVQGQEDATTDPFFDEFAESWVAPIINPGSASAGQPLFVRMNKDMIQESNGGPRYLTLNANDAYAETGMRTELIRRYAMGVDLPPEQLLGLQDSSHWSAWLVDESSWKAHLMPITQQMCNDFGSSYLRPAARKAGITNWARVVVGYDATEVINHPDKGKDFLDLYNARAVSKEALRRAKGATEDDAPSEDELNEMIGVQIRDGSLALYGIPSVRSNIEPEPGEIESATGSTDLPTAGNTGADVEKGPPPGGPPPREPVTASAYRILGGADVAVERCRELAGARLKRRAQNKKRGDCLARINGADNTLVAAALGDMLDSLADGDNLALVDGGAQSLVASVIRVGVSEDVAQQIAQQIEQHAADTLSLPDPGPLPDDLAALIEAVCV